MMKRIALLINLLVLALLASSFTIIENPGQLLGKAKPETTKTLPRKFVTAEKKLEKRDVSVFSLIDLSISADVYITQGKGHSLEIQASEKALQKIITKVKGDELIIEWKNNNYHGNGDITIKITVEEIDGLRIAGSGNIICSSALNSDELNLSIAGSGDITLKDLKARKIRSEVAGSGNIKLGGNSNVEAHKINIAGSGDVVVKKLQTKKVVVNIAGSGNCYVFATEELDVNIAGSGDVYYFGDPKVESNVMGSGDVEKL